MAARPSVPDAGLREVLRSWSGAGELTRALAFVGSEDWAQREWRALDVQRRAHRVLALELVGPIGLWPTSRRSWDDALPAMSTRERFWSERATPKVDWRRTFQRGWPPDHFATRRRRRGADELLTTALRWTVDRVLAVLSDASALHPEIAAPVRNQLAILRSLVDRDPLQSAIPERPGPAELASMRAAGRPWRAVSTVAARLNAVDRLGAEAYAYRYLLPDDEARPRLYHLGVLGEVLLAAIDHGASVISLRPIADGHAGPVYSITDERERRWDVWFEGAGAWPAYGVVEPYVRVGGGLRYLNGVPVANRPLSPDILLILPGCAALVVECKYSDADPAYVASGYSQAVAYESELLAIAPRVVAAVIGPDEFVSESRTAEIPGVGTVGIVDTNGLRSTVRSVLSTP